MEQRGTQMGVTAALVGPLTAVVVLATACGSSLPTAPQTPASSTPKLFVVALSAIVSERTTPYTGGSIKISFGTGQVIQQSVSESQLATRIDETHWRAGSPSEAFVFSVGEDYWIYLSDSSRSLVFQNPDYGDEFAINGMRLTRVGRITDRFLFIGYAVRRFKFTDVLGSME